MKTTIMEDEIKELLCTWNRAMVEKDSVILAELRDDQYSANLPDGIVLSKEEEIALISSEAHTLQSMEIQNLKIQAQENKATAAFDNVVKGDYFGEPINALYKYTVCFIHREGKWRAMSSHVLLEGTSDEQKPVAASGEPTSGLSGRRSTPIFRLRNFATRKIKSWLKENTAEAASFQQMAYLPYKPGLDFVIPAIQKNNIDTVSSDLPIPPKELWLGYNYPVHGEIHVNKMLEIVYASGFSFEKNDRILDLGCGAGRMIRHLKNLSQTCEIWGTDISAEHIYWCKQHLSPPFNFATTTKVPHLPFEDKSFDLIYCGSLFTHIDDLADAWLLELHRILTSDGRLYVTLHDSHTIEFFEKGKYQSSSITKSMTSNGTYQKSKESFGMFTMGRDNDSQVFYDTGYFSKMLHPLFDILSVTPEAYFYQTAFLLKRKSK